MSFLKYSSILSGNNTVSTTFRLYIIYKIYLIYTLKTYTYIVYTDKLEWNIHIYFDTDQMYPINCVIGSEGWNGKLNFIPITSEYLNIFFRSASFTSLNTEAVVKSKHSRIHLSLSPRPLLRYICVSCEIAWSNITQKIYF